MRTSNSPEHSKPCLDCGMEVSTGTKFCPKCDAELSLQSDGSIITKDIAHHGERVHEAMHKLDQLIEQGKADVTAKLRIIVGSGQIRDEANAILGGYLFRQDILGFEQDGSNQGAIIVSLRR
ncbi:MAG: Smr/MutS family protein [Pseudomonadales bacterium]|nr:Smr/MutS family protein [Pseudomonadales bacterium]